MTGVEPDEPCSPEVGTEAVWRSPSPLGSLATASCFILRTALREWPWSKNLRTDGGGKDVQTAGLVVEVGQLAAPAAEPAVASDSLAGRVLPCGSVGGMGFVVGSERAREGGKVRSQRQTLAAGPRGRRARRGCTDSGASHGCAPGRARDRASPDDWVSPATSRSCSMEPGWLGRYSVTSHTRPSTAMKQSFSLACFLTSSKVISGRGASAGEALAVPSGSALAAVLRTDAILGGLGCSVARGGALQPPANSKQKGSGKAELTPLPTEKHALAVHAPRDQAAHAKVGHSPGTGRVVSVPERHASQIWAKRQLAALPTLTLCCNVAVLPGEGSGSEGTQSRLRGRSASCSPALCSSASPMR